MTITISSFKAPAKERKDNAYDDVVSEMIHYEIETSDKALAEIVKPTDEIAKHITQFREAANFAGYRSRERSREDDGENVTVSFTIGKSKPRLESSPEGEDVDDAGEIDTGE